jgi:hypothetical protein
MALRLNPDRRWPFVINDESTPGLPRSTFVLLLVSGFSALSLLFTPPGLVALAFAIPAVVSWRRSKRSRCRKLTIAGWIAYAAVILLQVVITLADVGTG